MSVCMLMCMSVCMLMCMSVCMLMYMSVCILMYMSVCMLMCSLFVGLHLSPRMALSASSCRFRSTSALALDLEYVHTNGKLLF